MHLYNEIERLPAQWLRNLADAGYIDGPVTVDERSITDLTAADIADATQVHLFAGIGGWSHALKLAGWPAEQPVWTGSCPCQPFSVAGKGAGTDDARHLWPEMRRLIGECLPPVVFGEQVASRAGREWLAGVRADLEAMGYAVGAADLCAASAGAPHIRQRLYWGAVWLGDAKHNGPSAIGELGGAKKERGLLELKGSSDTDRRLADTTGERCGETGADQWRPAQWSSWSSHEWHLCLDGKTRRIPTEPELFPLAHGLPGRVGQLRAYGNAIVPALAAEFVMSFMETAI